MKVNKEKKRIKAIKSRFAIFPHECCHCREEFYFENMSEIGNKDLIYFMGVVVDKEGKVFSIYKEGISGEVFKQYTNSFPIRALSNINDINSEYTKEDYLI